LPTIEFKSFFFVCDWLRAPLEEVLHKSPEGMNEMKQMAICQLANIQPQDYSVLMEEKQNILV